MDTVALFIGHAAEGIAIVGGLAIVAAWWFFRDPALLARAEQNSRNAR